MKKKKAASAKTAIDNSFVKSIITQFDLVDRRVDQQTLHKIVLDKDDVIYCSTHNRTQGVNLSSKNTLIKEAILWFLKPLKQYPPQVEVKRDFIDRPLATLPFARNTPHNIASCILMRLVTDTIIKGGSSKCKGGKLTYNNSGISINLWASKDPGKVSAPVEEVTVSWLEEIETETLRMHLLFCTLVMGADTDKQRTFSVRVRDIVDFLGLLNNKKDFRNNRERVDYVLRLATHLGRVNYVLSWNKKAIDFSIPPDILWKVEVTERASYRDTVITVSPGKWAEKFLDSDPFIEYTTIDNRAFQIIKRHLARRPHIVRLLLHFLYQERINNPKGYGPINCKIKTLFVEMFGTKAFNKATRDMRTRRTLLERFYSALDILKEQGLVYCDIEETYILEERFLGKVDEEPPKTKLTGEIFSHIIDQSIILSRWPTDRKKAQSKEIPLAKIKEQRNSLGFTQRQFAAKIGVNYSTFKSFENGFRKLPREEMKKLKEVMGIPQDTKVVTYKGDKKLVL